MVLSQHAWFFMFGGFTRFFTAWQKYLNLPSFINKTKKNWLDNIIYLDNWCQGRSTELVAKEDNFDLGFH